MPIVSGAVLSYIRRTAPSRHKISFPSHQSHTARVFRARCTANSVFLARKRAGEVVELPMADLHSGQNFLKHLQRFVTRFIFHNALPPNINHRSAFLTLMSRSFSLPSPGGAPRPSNVFIKSF
ncbi:hypothetical protein TRVL_06546 [Trypanosoma vivax]|nr:hypothetical protein TRVL_06546 [Trypanosoma vivax]